ncbi:MAG: DNA gyrase inhibitor YacG [Phycisphaerae bacterium]|nr:DNA gyrase inhibitor YacG [Phycisphaerae bacterium]
MKKQCPVCGKSISKPSKTKGQVSNAGLFPFCSERCKLVDLDKWFRGEYVISSPIRRQEKDNENDSENMLEQ